LVERSRHPRHKVCGEFLSPGVLSILDSLGAGDFGGLRPAPIRRCRLHFGGREKRWNLVDSAYGLSRLELDRLLLDRAAALGVVVERGESASPGGSGETGVILALGRSPGAGMSSPWQESGRLNACPTKPVRLFGFKAHFEGPADDSIEMFFGRQGYVGVSPIENGWTNVCGIAAETVLRRHGFDADEYVAGLGPLAERLRPLRRRMEWLRAGPLCFSLVAGSAPGEHVYPAGDALGFVDPFTGSGILNALFTGRLAGRNAARAVPASQHLRECRSFLERPFGISAIFRKLIEWDCAWQLAALAPGPWLFRLTRAQFEK
jgi:flavin-dependent dehydrogenase